MISKYKEAKREEEMERFLTDALYQAASLTSYTSIEEVIKTIAESNYGALSREFEKTLNEIKTGAEIEQALEGMALRNKSVLLKRAVNLLILGCKTGADISDSLREIAEDISKTSEIYRERKTSMIIQKYTLFLGSIIVPLILGLMVSLILSLDLNALTEFGFGIQGQEKEIILNNAILGNQIYIAAYSVMASLFIAYQENNMKNSVIYILFLLPCSLILFNLAKTLNIFSLL